MDIAPQGSQTISDDQELSKVLAGISSDSDDKSQLSDLAASLGGDDNANGSPAPADQPTDPAAQATPTLPVEPEAPAPAEPVLPQPVAPVPVAQPGTDLEGIKRDALSELKPLVDKLTLSPEEMFDTYLLLIRSTDDKTLIGPAHNAAQKITDETRRAQALLEIVKEIDYLNGPK